MTLKTEYIKPYALIVIQMQRQIFKGCSKCGASDQGPVVLDCGHELCMGCLKGELALNQNRQMLLDDLQIMCRSCDCMTHLSVVLAYKLVKEVDRDSKNYETKLVCLQCWDEVFGVQELIFSKHKHHQIKSIQSVSPLVQSLLLSTSQSLEQTIDYLSQQKRKLFQIKGIINDHMHSNIQTIRVCFEQLREEIVQKELEVLDGYQKVVEREMGEVDEEVRRVTGEIERGRYHLREIAVHLRQKGRKDRSLRMVRYLIESHQEIENLSNPHRNNKQIEISPLSMMKLWQETIKLDELKQIISFVHKLSIIPDRQMNQVDKSGSKILDVQYFQNKRKEILGPLQNSNCYHLILDKLKRDQTPPKIQNLNNQIFIQPQKTPKRMVRFPKTINF